MYGHTRHPCRSGSEADLIGAVWDYVVVVQLLSHVRLFAAPWTVAHQVFLSFTISHSLLNLMSIESVMPSNHLILSCPLILLPSTVPSIKVFSNESLFASGSQSIIASASASVLSMNIQSWFPLWLTGWISLHSKGLPSLPQHHSSFKSINSSALSLLYSSTLTSIHDYWKNQSFDYTDLCWQSNVSAF